MKYYSLLVPIDDYTDFEEYCFHYGINFITTPLHFKNVENQHYHVLFYFNDDVNLVFVRRLFIPYFENIASVPSGLNKIIPITDFSKFISLYTRVD